MDRGRQPEAGKTPVTGPSDRRLWHVLVLAAVGPLAVLTLLTRQDVPLGCPDRLVYPYSPLAAVRLAAASIAVLIALVLGLAVWLAASSSPRRRRIGLLLAAVGAVGLGVWSYLAPPAHFSQHVFNTQSPSQDGAFVREALRVSSVRDYLRGFPQRARTPPAEMRGTRVVSNPPGTTLLMVGLAEVLRRVPALGDLATGPIRADVPPEVALEELLPPVALGLVSSWVLTGLWVSSGVFLYLIGRLFWPAGGAAAYSLCCVFSPTTLLFTPGKDPAQLLTVAVPLYFWLRAVRHRQVGLAVGAGLVTVLACLASLVHVWIALAVAVATFLNAWRSGSGLPAVWVRVVLPALCGAGLGMAALYLLCDLNLPATVLAVARAQAEVTRGPDAMPLAWQLLALPLFLLFAGPAWWATTLWTACPGRRPPRPADAHAGLGLYLVLASAAVMLITVGFTNLETPRLWIPFTPLLLLGSLLQTGRRQATGRRGALILAVLVAAQVAVSALMWSVMDMRETETRLVQQRFFG
jgi:hypothetical protein